MEGNRGALVVAMEVVLEQGGRMVTSRAFTRAANSRHWGSDTLVGGGRGRWCGGVVVEATEVVVMDQVGRDGDKQGLRAAYSRGCVESCRASERGTGMVVWWWRRR